MSWKDEGVERDERGKLGLVRRLKEEGWWGES